MKTKIFVISVIVFNFLLSLSADVDINHKFLSPTSKQPKSQSKNKSGRELSYDVPKQGGGSETKLVQNQTLDSSHAGQNHWEAVSVKIDPTTGKPRMNKYNRQKLANKKSKVNYGK